MYAVGYTRDGQTTFGDTYTRDLQEATDRLFGHLRRAKEELRWPGKRDDRSIALYQVEVWQNVATHKLKFEVVCKVVPSFRPTQINTSEAQKYLEAYDGPEMTITALAEHLYGPEPSEEEVVAKRAEAISQLVERCRQACPHDPDRPSPEQSIIVGDVCDNYGPIVSAYGIADEAISVLRNEYHISQSPGGSIVHLYLMSRARLDPLRDQLKAQLQNAPKDQQAYLCSKLLLAHQDLSPRERQFLHSVAQQA